MSAEHQSSSPPALPEHDSVRALLDELPEVVLLHRRGQVLYVNPACVQALGYDRPEDFLGKSMLDFLHPDDRAETVRRVEVMMRTQEQLPPRELRALHKDGSILWMDLAPVRLVELPDGPASLVLARDRTMQRKLQERLEETDRLASLGSLASGVAARVSNPLTYVLGNLTVLSESMRRVEGADDNLQTELLKAIADAREGAERIRDLIGDLRVFSRPGLGRRERLDLRKVLDSAINMAWPEIRPRARLVRDYGATPDVRGVESKLALAFYHLLMNAAQAIDRGAADQEAVRVALGTTEKGWALVELEDSGRGLSPEVAARMWEPFFTTHVGEEGAGLGLPVVRSVVAAMGGDIQIDAAPERGVRVQVVLPPCEPAPQRDELSRRPRPEPEEERHGRVLVVGDEPVIGALVRRALEGHDVYLINSGRDAAELVTELEFDVMICDLVMPDLGGIELHQLLAERRPAMASRIVFVGSGAYSRAEREFLDEVSNLVLDKPFEFSELREAVQAVLRE